MDGFAIVPPPGKGEGFVELTSSAKGRVFEKHILSYGDLLYPGVRGGKVKIDDDFADTLIANFTNNVTGIVQVPKAGADNEHTEDPDRNIGEVIGLSKRNGKIYARIEARDPEAADKIANKLFLGASAMLHLNYTNTKTMKKVGPTLLHVAITNRPYVADLEDFNELLAASADSTKDAVFLTASTEKEKPMTLDELFAELKADHNIDVPELQKLAAGADSAVALSNKIQEELVGTGLLKLSNGEEATADDLVEAVSEAGNRIVELSNKVDSLVEDSAKKDASAEVEKLVLSGHILDKDKDAMLELRLSNKSLFDKLVPEKPVVQLSNERGTSKEEDLTADAVNDEIARLSASPAAAAYIRQS